MSGATSVTEYDATKAQDCYSPVACEGVKPGDRAGYVTFPELYPGPKPWCPSCLRTARESGVEGITPATDVQLCARSPECTKAGWKNTGGRGKPPVYVCGNCGLPGAKTSSTNGVAPPSPEMVPERGGLHPDLVITDDPAGAPDEDNTITISHPEPEVLAVVFPETVGPPAQDEPVTEQPEPEAKRGPGRPRKPTGPLIVEKRGDEYRWCVVHAASGQALLIGIASKAKATPEIPLLLALPIDWEQDDVVNSLRTRTLVQNEQLRVLGSPTYREGLADEFTDERSADRDPEAREPARSDVRGVGVGGEAGSAGEGEDRAATGGDQSGDDAGVPGGAAGGAVEPVAAQGPEGAQGSAGLAEGGQQAPAPGDAGVVGPVRGEGIGPFVAASGVVSGPYGPLAQFMQNMRATAQAMTSAPPALFGSYTTAGAGLHPDVVTPPAEPAFVPPPMANGLPAPIPLEPAEPAADTGAPIVAVGLLAQFAASAKTPVVGSNGNTPWAAAYAVHIRELVYAHAARSERTLQKHLGPSEIGVECDRQVIGKLAGVPRTNHVVDPWPSILGTAAHVWLADAFDNANLQLEMKRWWTETKVVPHPEHGGTSDLYDAETFTVGDHKVLGETTMEHIRRPEGPSIKYKRQVRLYGRGFRLLGARVDRVAVIAYPRTAGTLDGIYVWEEPLGTEADEDIDQLFARMAWRQQWADAVTSGQATLDQAPAVPDAEECYFCPFYRPQSAKDGGPGCPGHAGLS